MIIRHPNQADWVSFSALAAAENWRVPDYELRLFQGHWHQYAYVLDDAGFSALVTAVSYEKSAWIGNLIVPPERRNKGYGSYLFRAVLNGLLEQGMASIWLTASDQGLSIYERESFRALDGVERWVLPTCQDVIGQTETFFCDSDDKLLLVDAQVWGESRAPLLSEICKSGKIVSVGNSVALVQQSQDQQIVGPWYTSEESLTVNHDLLQKIIAIRDTSKEIVIDCLASAKIQSLCMSVGFERCGQTTLMVYGDIKGIQLKNMVSLASLGSIG